MRAPIRFRRQRKRVGGDFELQLTSMMDVLVVVLVFLLKSYATSQHNFSSVQGIQLPMSQSPELPSDSLQVIVTPEAITFEAERVVEFIQTPASLEQDASYEFNEKDLDENRMRITPLYDALLKAKEKADLLRAKSQARDERGQPLPFEGLIAIQADKRVNYDTVRRIMYTAATAGYAQFRFLAMRKE